MFARSADELAGLHGIEKKRKVQGTQFPGKGGGRYLKNSLRLHLGGFAFFRDTLMKRGKNNENLVLPSKPVPCLWRAVF